MWSECQHNTEQQKKRRMNTKYQHGRFQTVFKPDALKTIQVAFHPPIGLSRTVMIQNDVRLHNVPKTIHAKLLWLSYFDDLKSRRFFCCSVYLKCNNGVTLMPKFILAINLYGTQSQHLDCYNLYCHNTLFCIVFPSSPYVHVIHFFVYILCITFCIF